jgi:hypothetical protein
MGAYWRRVRRFTQSMLNTAIVQQSASKQTTEPRQMVVDLVKEPGRYAYWLERAGGMASLKQVYGATENRGSSEEHQPENLCIGPPI